MRLPKLLLTLLAMTAVAQSKRPPWYKPCWIFLCGMDLTDPVCAWDPHHGARLFRNDCEMDRHNFCYNRNYAIVDGENNVEQDMKMCRKLRNIVKNADKSPAAVVQDENIRVHFLEDPNRTDKRRKSHTKDRSDEHFYRRGERYDAGRRLRERYGYRPYITSDRYGESSIEDDSSYEPF